MCLFRRSVLAGLGMLLASGLLPGGATEVSERALMSHVGYLASGMFEGRLAGQLGDQLAEGYIQALFEQVGLSPVPELGGYRQEFIINEAVLDREQTGLSWTRDGRATRCKLDEEVFYLVRRNTDITVTAPVVFAGYGITAPEYDYDDYAGLEVAGKIVLVLDGEPGGPEHETKFRGRAPTRHSFARAKEAAARTRGAAGVIMIKAGDGPDFDQTLPRRYAREMSQPYFSLAGSEDEIPLFYATRPAARAILKGTGVDPEKIRERINSSFETASTPLADLEMVLEVKLESVTEKTVANVAGYLPGADPALREEYIVIAAHHDHLGLGSRSEIYYGADDNASGVAGLLEAARYFGSMPSPPARSLLFVSFCGEEQGLLGSTYFADHPPVPLPGLRVLINLDMIGRNNMDKPENSDMFIVFTSAQTPELERLVRAGAESLSQDVRVAPYLRFHGSSDHIVFHDRGVPVVFYFSGFHSDYSRPTDRIEKIISGKLVKVTMHLCGLISGLSTRKDLNLEFDRTITEEPPRDEYENPYARPGPSKGGKPPQRGH